MARAEVAHRPTAAERGGHPGDQHRAQAPVGDRRRAAGRRLPRAGGGAHHLRRHRRRSDAHRLRPVRARPDHRSPTRKRCSPSTASSSADRFPRVPSRSEATNKVIATAYRSLEAAAEVFRRRGIRPLILGDTITGEAREVGREMARWLASAPPGPAALISGGECTVTIKGEGGRGGRCCEFLLSLGIEAAGLWAIAADTDGIDGSEDNAGADPHAGRARQRARRARGPGQARQLRILQCRCGDLVVTGPTRTNVNDYRAIRRIP